MRDVLNWCRAEARWLRETIEALVQRESPTTDKSAVDRCGAELQRRLEALGGIVQRLERSDAGDHLRAEFGTGDRQILLLGHFDTVWPLGQLERMPIVERGGRLHGPGVYDMKAGIAVGMLATRVLVETSLVSSRRVVMLWTTDEETGSGTSRAAIEDEARRSEAVLVLEPPTADGSVKTSRKGCGAFHLVVHGISAHAGVEPDKGASAIHELARQIARVLDLHDPARGVSVNVGTVAGGSRANVTAERAEAVVDVRAPTTADAARLDFAIRGLTPVDPRIRLEVTGGFDRPPMERSAGVGYLFEIARAVAEELGRPMTEAGTGGGSDGNFTAALGVSTLDGLGAFGDGAHALHEHVVIDELPWRAAVLAGLMARFEPPR